MSETEEFSGGQRYSDEEKNPGFIFIVKIENLSRRPFDLKSPRGKIKRSSSVVVLADLSRPVAIEGRLSTC